MILSKLVIKTLFYNFILNNNVTAVYFPKKQKDLLALLLCQQVTHTKIICEGNTVRLLYLT